jgi:hypothetical protein
MFTHLNGVLNEVQRLSCVRSACEHNETAMGAIHILNLRYAQVRQEYEDIQKDIKDNHIWIKQNPPQTYMRLQDRKRLENNILQCRKNIEILTD